MAFYSTSSPAQTSASHSQYPSARCLPPGSQKAPYQSTPRAFNTDSIPVQGGPSRAQPGPPAFAQPLENQFRDAITPFKHSFAPSQPALPQSPRVDERSFRLYKTPAQQPTRSKISQPTGGSGAFRPCVYNKEPDPPHVSPPQSKQLKWVDGAKHLKKKHDGDKVSEGDTMKRKGRKKERK
ncbi:hypothetical protein BV25DRAFT_1835169 [Artomyces pyxidatus]|uniref:Uncharacterized protein n=1 Tax=Artomyces pyxidatus TaxID=48021 RepID=A0ACB8TGD8_9AGAM|nr:hypothetical protein BV25DRAFT_1835169 [Artomyces pyxidatus]